MNIFGYMVVKNELGRYLRESVKYFADAVDGLLIYDDRSDDLTPELIKELVPAKNTTFLIRPPGSPSFADSESDFRQEAWDMMVRHLKPRSDDWILTLDADEFLRMRTPDSLRQACRNATEDNFDGLWMHVHEVWGRDDWRPLVRTDGWWGEISALRLCRYQPKGVFKGQFLGGGSLPDNIHRPGRTQEVEILHFGYMTQEDREAKYRRYLGTPGHNPRHINSILQQPVLAEIPDFS